MLANKLSIHSNMLDGGVNTDPKSREKKSKSKLNCKNANPKLIVKKSTILFIETGMEFKAGGKNTLNFINKTVTHSV